MGPTRRRDLAAAAIGAAVAGYPMVLVLFRSFPRSRCGPGCHCWGCDRRGAVGPLRKSQDQRWRDRDGSGQLHPLAVARSLMVAKASAWVGALVLGWWIAVLVYLLPRRSWLRVAAEDMTGALVAAASALALIVAALWLQHCCKSPQEPPERGEGAEG